MQIGVVGLGRMGANTSRRLMKAGHSSVVWDASQGAIEEAVPAASPFTRFRSRRQHTFAEKVLSAMRFGFGRHVEPTKK